MALAASVARALSSARLNLNVPVSLDLKLDMNVLLFTIVVSVVTGLIFGLVPAVRVTSRDVSASLRDDAGERIGARRRFGLTGILVSGQVAVPLLLLTVASVFMESLVRARSADPGLAWRDVSFTQVSLQPLGLGFVESMAMWELIEDRLEALPEVGRATVASRLPAALRGTSTLLVGSGITGVDVPTEVPWNVVSTDFFEVLEIPILYGRAFSDTDAGGTEVAIVSEAMARAYWGRTDLVGEMFRPENDPDNPVEIVGVVGDVAVQWVGESATPSFYRPIVQWGAGRPHFVYHAQAPSAQTIAAVTGAIRAVDSRILVLRASTLRDHFGDRLERARLAGVVLSALGALALLLSVLGIYGVVSFAVSRRQREVGIRMALGAGRDSVVRLFIRDVAGVVIGGAVVGLAVSLPAGRFIGQEFTGAAGSLWLLVLLAAGLVGTALLATLAPAMRAANTDPRDTLRQE